MISRVCLTNQVSTWINLENVTLNERSRTKMETYCLILLFHSKVKTFKNEVPLIYRGKENKHAIKGHREENPNMVIGLSVFRGNFLDWA